ncbi:ComEC family competence protein [Patescibacteria group bacterium]|nr:MAG: ComEC family competence protein [Patescibacteria group bacterium]
MSRPVQFVVLFVALVVGIMVGRSGYAVELIWVVGLTGAWLCLVLVGSRLAFGFLTMAFLLFGVWRGYQTDLPRTWLGQHLNQKAVVVGTIADDPAMNQYGNVEFTLSGVQLDGVRVAQSIKVRLASYKSLRRGYRVVVTGKLAETLGAAPVRISFAQIQVVSTEIGWLERLRGRFFIALKEAVPEPMSGFAVGILVGARAVMTDELQRALSVAGLTHLVAVSGYNLTILAQAAQRICGRFSLFVATAVTLWLVAGFVGIAGFSASIIRASMVAGLGLLITYYGYEARPATILAVPGILTLAWNPDYLIRDMGWQLSFLAFFGVLVFAPLLEQRLIKNPTMLKSLFIESTSAHIITLPLIMWRFETVSVVAPLVNVIILPLVPLAMLLSFITGLLGMAHTGLTAVAAWPTTGLLSLIIAAAMTAKQLPFASVSLGASPWQVAAAYGLIAAVTWFLYRGSQGVPQVDSNRLAGTVVAKGR